MAIDIIGKDTEIERQASLDLRSGLGAGGRVDRQAKVERRMPVGVDVLDREQGGVRYFISEARHERERMDVRILPPVVELPDRTDEAKSQVGIDDAVHIETGGVAIEFAHLDVDRAKVPEFRLLGCIVNG